PLDTRMKRIIDKLRKGEEVEYGFLGIKQPGRWGRTPEVSWEPTDGGPAAMAGMILGDEIVAIDGERITEPDDLLLNISASLAGTQIRLTVEGRGGRRDLWPTLVKTNWPSNGPVIAANQPEPVHGLRVDYTSAMIQGSVGPNARIPSGVMVREV